jgi:hypothetical protein
MYVSNANDTMFLTILILNLYNDLKVKLILYNCIFDHVLSFHSVIKGVIFSSAPCICHIEF